MRIGVFSVQDHYPSGPRSVPEVYGQVLDQIALAEQLGFNDYWVAEHHFHHYGVCPNPAILLAAAGQRTRYIRLGTAVSVLPFRHPIDLAENWAMVDALSGGRLNLAVGSGYLQHEFEGFGIPASEKRARFDEALNLMLRLWNEEKVVANGQYYALHGATLNVRPVQRPHPPLWVAVLRPEAAYWVGRANRSIMAIPYASFDHLREVRGMIQQYRQGIAEAGGVEHPSSVVLAFHAYVSDSDALAEREVEGYAANYLQSRLYAKRASLRELFERNLALIGSPRTVRQQLTYVAQETGAQHVLLLNDFGGMPLEMVAASLRRFASEVMPMLSTLEEVTA